MTTQETQLATRPDAPVEWGKRDEIVALGNRLKAMMPGKLSGPEALLLAQYSASMGANPFRGEIYAYEDKGKLILVEGYKLLVRWARRQSNFYERYERLADDELPDNHHIGFRCRILRQDAAETLAMLTKAGVPDAYEICSTEAVGIVKKNKRPPNGWTVEEVARKRALKNALNRAYGAPSPREIAKETWMVEDTQTTPEDWQATADMTTPEAEAIAKRNALRRQSTPPEESAAESTELLFGNPQQVVESTTTQPQDTVEDEDPLSQLPPDEESGKETDNPPPNGLDRLFTEVNLRLLANTLEQYKSKEAMIKVLKSLGHRKYVHADHGTYISQLIMQREPNGF